MIGAGSGLWEQYTKHQEVQMGVTYAITCPRFRIIGRSTIQYSKGDGLPEQARGACPRFRIIGRSTILRDLPARPLYCDLRILDL